MNTALKELIAKVETWPEDAQADLTAIIEQIQRDLDEPVVLSEDDLAALERSAEDVRAGRLHTLEEIRALFDPYRDK